MKKVFIIVFTVVLVSSVLNSCTKSCVCYMKVPAPGIKETKKN